MWHFRWNVQIKTVNFDTHIVTLPATLKQASLLPDRPCPFVHTESGCGWPHSCVRGARGVTPTQTCKVTDDIRNVNLLCASQCTWHLKFDFSFLPALSIILGKICLGIQAKKYPLYIPGKMGKVSSSPLGWYQSKSPQLPPPLRLRCGSIQGKRPSAFPSQAHYVNTSRVSNCHGP